MKVMVIGYPKTGTQSMHAALQELGYKVYDVENHFYYLGKEWMRIFEQGATKEDFRRMYEGVDATVSTPANYFWEEMLEAFPDAKLVFTRRETEDEWAVSYQRQAEAMNSNKMLMIMNFLSPTARRMGDYLNTINRIMFSTAPRTHSFWFAAMKTSPTLARKRYREHNSNVMMRAPKGQLLEFDVRDGWKPLCEFLNKPVPNRPFPHLNIRGAGIKEILPKRPVFKQMIREAKTSLAVIMAFLSVASYFVICWFS